jgi:ADP-ribose pyrophosphatase YjhB (NUDIX family)
MGERKFGLGVFVCVFNKDFSKILLLKRNEEKRKRWEADWGNVGGKLEFGETSEEACLREAREEISLELDKKNIQQVKIIETPNSVLYGDCHTVHIVYATPIPENTKIKINPESEGYEWFSLDNLPEKMLDKKEDILDIADKSKKLFKK